ncbi:Zinc-binding domain of primase-helicase [Malonomonas rubra DSM 5091]|uniref:Zinc-binding domain of primase-helicase n=1 Tax=Malonomonas rubra DSM 5091 TaxID=1122189 RepID=A0A1M6HP56_MALRU|nr:primase-helicase zinc-binding domain-containing protein [Malonomonas rubra]SHJ23985.1 Zinc-binding domain of primase-helicase [Malonomonas rubra DSM 5091]
MIFQLLSDHGITPKRISSHKGGEYHSPCPRCGGTDRFHVWPEQYDGQGSFWCRNCDIGGDCIKFLMEYSGYSFRQAADRTGKKLDEQGQGQGQGSGYSTPKLSKQQQKKPTQPRECLPPIESWQAAARDLLEKAQVALLANQEQLAYLAGRGLPIKAVKQYGLGWIDTKEKDCTFSSRKKWGIDPKAENKRPDALWLPRGILIPNIIADGQTVRVDSLRIRRPKADRLPPLEALSYHVVPGGGTAPLLLHDQQLAIVVVEAQLDGMLCHDKAGDLVGVLALGNSTARPDERSMAALRRAKLILVALDFDDNHAGGKAWERWQRDFDHVKRWPVPQGKDPGEAYQAGVDIRSWLLSGLPPVWRKQQIVPAIEEYTAPEKPRAWKLHTKSGREICIVADKRDKQLYFEKTGLVTLDETDLEKLKQMDRGTRNECLKVLAVFGGSVESTGPYQDKEKATTLRVQDVFIKR